MGEGTVRTVSRHTYKFGNLNTLELSHFNVSGTNPKVAQLNDGSAPKSAKRTVGPNKCSKITCTAAHWLTQSHLRKGQS